METQNLFGQFIALEGNGKVGSSCSSYDVFSTEMYIGRDKTCDIFIDSKVISRKHAKISIGTQVNLVLN